MPKTLDKIYNLMTEIHVYEYTAQSLYIRVETSNLSKMKT